jgi:rare lipoprotein A
LLFLRFCALASFFVLLAGCSSKSIYTTAPTSSTQGINNSANMHRATMRPYTIGSKTYYPTMVSIGETFSGVASWYGKDFHGRKTSNGEIYNMYDLTAAHKTLPMNTMVRVTHLENDKSVVVRINDRGPFVKSRIIDLSYTAAKRIDMIKRGTAPVRLEVIGFDGIVGDRPGHHSIQGGNFMVQIGAFRRKEGAGSFSKEFSTSHPPYKTFVQEGMWLNEPIYRVYLTGFRSEEEARDFIAKGYFDGAFILRDSK